MLRLDKESRMESAASAGLLRHITCPLFWGSHCGANVSSRARLLTMLQSLIQEAASYPLKRVAGQFLRQNSSTPEWRIEPQVAFTTF